MSSAARSRVSDFADVAKPASAPCPDHRRGPGAAVSGRIEPARSFPGEGETTRITLPGVGAATRIDLLRLGPGISVALSQFAPGRGREDVILWPAGRLLIAFNLLGIMTIRDAAGRDHDICNGEGWVLRTNSEALTRVLHPGQGCSNLVIVIEAEAVTERLCRVIAQELPDPGMVRRFRLSRPARGLPERFFLMAPTPRRRCCARREIASPSSAMSSRNWRSRAVRGPCPRAMLLVARTEALLRDRLAETFSLDDLAQDLGLSHVTLNRCFRRETGTTVFERLRELRLERAAELIGHQGRSLTEIAYDCGFSSPSHLSTAFRKRFGMTARSWRRHGSQRN
ncbi:helix-turn-helix domain-containing protein [Rhodobacter capsulatus]|uniref:helix-turn-helix domain-containing protein n=1 Tax=Rhodobacter capsulatus TaxID=1061 RepID=UPI0040295ED5